MPTNRQIEKLILASASPRRAELLRAANIPFTVIISPTDEPAHKPPTIPTHLWPMCLAYIKATAVQSLLTKNQKSKIKNQKFPIILAADTIVLLGDRILNKAPTRASAKKMLSALSGKIHHVLTGIALVQQHRVRLASATATCRMKKLSPRALEHYLDSNLWRNKAGAYGIQDRADPFITLLSGDFTTVVGLPMNLLQSELATFLQE